MVDVERWIIDELKAQAQEDEILKNVLFFADTDNPDTDVNNSIRAAYVDSDIYPSIEVLEMDSRDLSRSYARQEAVTEGEVQIQVVCNINFQNADGYVYSVRNSCMYMLNFVRRVIEADLRLTRMSLLRPISNGSAFIGNLRYRYLYNNLNNKIM